jgi:hypothetical protein
VSPGRVSSDDEEVALRRDRKSKGVEGGRKKLDLASEVHVQVLNVDDGLHYRNRAQCEYSASAQPLGTGQRAA